MPTGLQHYENLLGYTKWFPVNYNPGYNILALFNDLADVLIPTSKTILDI